MLKQRNASRQSSRMLTERINATAMSGTAASPWCTKLIEEKVSTTHTRIAQRKTTIPIFISPGNPESAERKTSMHTNSNRIALAI